MEQSILIVLWQPSGQLDPLTEPEPSKKEKTMNSTNYEYSLQLHVMAAVTDQIRQMRTAGIVACSLDNLWQVTPTPGTPIPAGYARQAPQTYRRVFDEVAPVVADTLHFKLIG
jgi:hypothetical protein